MKVLIVEDEYYTRKAIEKMVRDWPGKAEAVNGAENGRYAVQSIENELPDVIITDIRMPGMDGLELCEYVRNTRPSIFMVIVSGYAEFEYAQKAIAYDVQDYLLKPVDKEVLFGILDKLQTELEMQKKSISEQEAIRRKADMLTVLQGLGNALYGQTNEFTCFRDIFDIEREPEGFILGIVEAQPFTEKLLETVSCISSSSADIFPFYLHINRIGVVHLFFENGVTDASDRNAVLFKRYIDELSSKFGCRVSVGISGYHKAFSEMPAACREAGQMLNYKLINGLGKVFDYKRERNCRSNSYAVDEDIFRSFCLHLESGEKEEAELLVRAVFDEFLNSYVLSVDSLQQLFLKFMTAINDSYRLLEERNLMMPCYAEKLKIESFSTMEDLLHYITSNISSVCSGFLSGNRKEREQIIDDLKRYVTENYHTDIILEELAEKRYFIDVCYLSRLFKSATGESFSKYLTGVRMSKAKKLIEDSNMKVADVASFVGYNAVSHFVQVFKKYYGVTPGGYNEAQKYLPPPLG